MLDVVEAMDLRPFYLGYRQDGWGGAAHEPRMMVALLLYAYCVGERSSRKIERRCEEDIAFRVICGNNSPDHTTIARFRRQNERALASCFTEVLRLCAEAGLVRIGTVALDGTKISANASLRANRSKESIEAEVAAILAEAAAADGSEDDAFGEGVRGDELPQSMRARQGSPREARRLGALRHPGGQGPAIAGRGGERVAGEPRRGPRWRRAGEGSEARPFVEGAASSRVGSAKR